ncbi:AmmeMemoRadiSam system radical SAM enzyme [Neomoorella thermoacetica]|uniref:Pyruvate-formate lyase-activating enzyme n=1 Tax=Moorella thermoacetica Y72 TaxID=1325331 RepID=A0A0S6UDB1_NEOTH|nr:AmmeMemoRadiSam system radical SAM enzyme [Moorella thermoacetica]APC09497.1 cyclic pyranopterin monophosphate synthase [Moorella thermoacetica]GAF25529.1 pyruvate-formate lyase-activating enzyme [Moorella thermoacetica Y72]
MHGVTEAAYYVKLPGEKVECRLCPHTCVIAPGKRGVCRVRENREGRLITRNYGRCSSLALDPIEKKPLYHFYPGSLILSAGTVGCNFSCDFCQNWEIAQQEPETVVISPDDLVRKAREVDSLGIAYTYSEPLVWFEFVLATAQLARNAGLKNVMVTNGFIRPEPLKELLPWIDAWNIDVKGFSLEFYRKVVKGDYRPVLKTAAAAVDSGSHVEITTLLVTGLNDESTELEELVKWVATNLGVDTPLHFSRYFPRYRLEAPPTPLETMRRARDMARKHLHYVYLGNVADPEANNTYCPVCGELVIRRTGYHVSLPGLDGRICRSCGSELAIVR